MAETAKIVKLDPTSHDTPNTQITQLTLINTAILPHNSATPVAIIAAALFFSYK